MAYVKKSLTIARNFLAANCAELTKRNHIYKSHLAFERSMLDTKSKAIDHLLNVQTKIT